MVFRIQASLRFASAAARTSGHTTIDNAIAGRNTTVLRNFDKPGPGGTFVLSWEATDTDTGDAGQIYALIQAMASPQPGSRAYHHTCFHGDNDAPCLKTAEKVW